MPDARAPLAGKVDGFSPQPMHVIGQHYLVEREIGRGGAGIVYEARDTRTGTLVAVKVLRPELSSLVASQRFEQEILLLAGFQHPNLLPVLDSGESDGLPFYVAPLLEAQTLRHRLERERQLPLEDVLTIVRETADALQYSHDRGVI